MAGAFVVSNPLAAQLRSSDRYSLKSAFFTDDYKASGRGSDAPPLPPLHDDLPLEPPALSDVLTYGAANGDQNVNHWMDCTWAHRGVYREQSR
jgi:hypothetical protein